MALSAGDTSLSGRKLKAAVSGVGYLGRFHAQKYARIAGVELVAVMDRQLERAKLVGQEWGVGGVDHYVDLLPQVDLVSVVTPTCTHFEVAQACLQAGVHVLLEKPMTLSLAEADQLIELADRQGVLLQVGHIKRFHPAVMALDESGLVSAPRFIECQRFAPFKSRALDVDVVLDLMIHDVDLLLHFVHSEVVAIEAIGERVVSEHVDIANARIRFQNGCVANVSASRIARDAARCMQIFQTNQLIELDFMRSVLSVTQPGSRVQMVDGLSLPQPEAFQWPVTPHDALEAEIRAFCQAVWGGFSSGVSGRDGRRALAVVLTIQQSIAAFRASMG